MTGKSVKDVDRYQAVLANLLLEEDNKFCADCQSKGSANLAAGEGSSGPGAWPAWGGGFWNFMAPESSVNGNACYSCGRACWAFYVSGFGVGECVGVGRWEWGRGVWKCPGVLG
jgi:hypothetical protein